MRLEDLVKKGPDYQLDDLCSPFKIIPPHEWGGKPYKQGADFEPMKHPVKHVIFTYFTDTPECDDPESCRQTVKQLQQRYLDKGHPDLPYNFLVGGDNNIYEARGWDLKPVKNELFPEFHDSSVEIAFIGDYRMYNPPTYLIATAMELVDEGERYEWISPRYRLHEPVVQDVNVAEIMKNENNILIENLDRLRLGGGGKPNVNNEQVNLKGDIPKQNDFKREGEEPQ